jgi:hypothetical protein
MQGEVLDLLEIEAGMLRFTEGTGKWKGITGQFESDTAASASKPAVAGSFHTCTKWKGAFQVAQ